MTPKLTHSARAIIVRADADPTTPVRAIMTAPPKAVPPRAPLWAAAMLMKAFDVGMLVVQEGERPVGVVTDRDIALGLASCAVANAEVTVSKAMKTDVHCCHADQPVQAAAERMGDLQVRRLLVLDEKGKAVGVLSLGDIARDISELLAGQTLGEVVEAR